MSGFERIKQAGIEFYEKFSNIYSAERFIGGLDFRLSTCSMKTYNLYFAEGVLDAAKKDNNEAVVRYVSGELNKMKKELKMS